MYMYTYIVHVLYIIENNVHSETFLLFHALDSRRQMMFFAMIFAHVLLTAVEV